MSTATIDQPIRDAATIVLLRRSAPTPAVLMGQRGQGAAFMPSKFVFPGGRVDPADGQAPAEAPQTADIAQLSVESALPPHALINAALRELREETGLSVAQAPAPVRFFFRAITPPGRPRRFDARFFLCPAEAVAGDLDDFSAADDELSHLAWVPLPQTQTLDLPFITQVVLAELEAILAAPEAPRPIPFFDNTQAISRFRAL